MILDEYRTSVPCVSLVCSSSGTIHYTETGGGDDSATETWRHQIFFAMGRRTKDVTNSSSRKEEEEDDDDDYVRCTVYGVRCRKESETIAIDAK